ncbi:MAG: (2Fe-2S)-binding protein [Kofleriaceae bacterium]|nr:(2Fe-2S)-binding protein [Kofleriaceae bacterium]
MSRRLANPPRANPDAGVVAARPAPEDRVAAAAPDPWRGQPVELRLDGRRLRAFAGESAAAAALADGAHVLARSLKYHRPRSSFCLEGHCAGCLVRVDGVPNQRACQVACRDGLEVEGQNAVPSTDHDLLGAVDFLFAGGMDHHTLMTGSALLNKVTNKVVRQLSGLGRLPATVNRAQPEVGQHDVDVCVIGGGAAGLAAAGAAAGAGAMTLLIDDQLAFGGSLWTDPAAGAGAVAAALAGIDAAGVIRLGAATAIGFFADDDDEAAAAARGVLLVAGADRAWRVRARHWVWATGGYPTNLMLADNDRPGVLAARAVGRLLAQHGILGGERIALVTAAVPADARADASARVAADGVTRLAGALRAAGAEVQLLDEAAVRGVLGRGWVTGLALRDGRTLEADLVGVGGLPAPASEGPRQQRCEVELQPDRGGFVVVVDADGRTSTPAVWACGDVCGYLGPAAAARHGQRVGAAAGAAARPGRAAGGAREVVP